MPHGLTIDHEGNTWLTDVAMHQVSTQSSGTVDRSNNTRQHGFELVFFCHFLKTVKRGNHIRLTIFINIISFFKM